MTKEQIIERITKEKTGTSYSNECILLAMEEYAGVQNKVLIDALKEIASPIEYMRSRLQEGEILNGVYAMQIADDPNYLKKIATTALASYADVAPQEVSNDTMKEAVRKGRSYAMLNHPTIFSEAMDSFVAGFKAASEGQVTSKSAGVWVNCQKALPEIESGSDDPTLYILSCGNDGWRGNRDLYHCDAEKMREIIMHYDFAEWLDEGEAGKLPEQVELLCMVCGKAFMGELPQMCCSGQDCGCMGMPIDPIVCSKECYNNLPHNISKRQHQKESKLPEQQPVSSEAYKYCNHHHELTTEHQVVDFGDGEFVANKAAIPLLKALNESGLKTRSHHMDTPGQGFVCILMDNVDIDVRPVYEKDATRTKYNGKKEICIQWGSSCKGEVIIREE